MDYGFKLTERHNKTNCVSKQSKDNKHYYINIIDSTKGNQKKQQSTTVVQVISRSGVVIICCFSFDCLSRRPVDSSFRHTSDFCA